MPAGEYGPSRSGQLTSEIHCRGGRHQARGAADRRQQPDLARGVEAELAVLGRAAAIDVEQARKSVEAQRGVALGRPQVDHGGGDVGFEVDDRRAEELDARTPGPAAEDVGGAPSELQVLVVVPDSPLAAVDRLADLEALAQRREVAGELRDRSRPPRRIAHQLAVLRQREGELDPAPGERASERELVVVALLPGMQADHRPPRAEAIEGREQGRRILRPGTQRDPRRRPGEGNGRRAALRRELPIAAADARQRSGKRARRPQMLRQVGDPDARPGEPPGVLMRLIGEPVPDRPIADLRILGRRRDVGMNTPRHEPRS